MNTVFKLIACLPDSVKADTIDISHCKLKDGRSAVRITIDRLLTENEIDVMALNRDIIGLKCRCYHAYAPEIKYSYFYVATSPYIKRKGRTEK